MAHHRKKVAGHKLDYDCKKRHGEQGTGMVESEKKFAESYKVSKTILSWSQKKCVVFQAAQLSMNNVMENEQEYIMQINALSTSLNVGTYSLLFD